MLLNEAPSTDTAPKTFDLADGLVGWVAGFRANDIE